MASIGDPLALLREYNRNSGEHLNRVKLKGNKVEFEGVNGGSKVAFDRKTSTGYR